MRDLGRILACSTLAGALVACGPAGDPVGPDELRQGGYAIVNGQAERGYEPVGVISAGGGLCTATLIGKQVVLTAAHCVTPGRSHVFVAGQRYWRVTSVIPHPDYNTAYTDNDVALALLQDAPPIKPAAISTKPPARGQELTLLGYGAIAGSGAGSGAKRVGKNNVAYLTSTRIVISGAGGQISNLCFGDSGGPTFATVGGHEVQVGVHSTIAGDCGMVGHDMRVDVFAEWIKEVAKGDVSEDGKPSPLLDETPPEIAITSPAPDASVPFRFEVAAEIVDEGGVASGQILVDGEPGEILAQPPFVFALELEAGRHELTVVGEDLLGHRAERSLTVEVRAPLPFGETCALGDECASGLCVGAADDLYCTQLCEPDAEPCPDGAACLPASGGKHACGRPAAPAATEPDEPLDGEGGPAAADEVGGAPSGCAIAAGPAPAPGWLLLLGLLWGLRRRGQR